MVVGCAGNFFVFYTPNIRENNRYFDCFGSEALDRSIILSGRSNIREEILVGRKFENKKGSFGERLLTGIISKLVSNFIIRWLFAHWVVSICIVVIIVCVPVIYIIQTMPTNDNSASQEVNFSVTAFDSSVDDYVENLNNWFIYHGLSLSLSDTNREMRGYAEYIYHLSDESAIILRFWPNDRVLDSVLYLWPSLRETPTEHLQEVPVMTAIMDSVGFPGYEAHNMIEELIQVLERGDADIRIERESNGIHGNIAGSVPADDHSFAFGLWPIP